MIAAQPVIDFENRYLDKDGTVRWLLWPATLIDYE